MGHGVRDSPEIKPLTRDHDVSIVSFLSGITAGLFGIDLGHLFIGESMFHRSTDASKVAIVRLAEMLTERCGEDWTVDVQWSTPHLESLGVSELSGLDYLVRLRQAEARDGSELFYR